MKLCAVQIRSIPGDIEANIKKHQKLISLAISHAADVIIFPELSLTGYEPAMAKALATTQDDPRLDLFQEMSNQNGVVIGVGLPTQKGSDECISMILFQPYSKRQTYSKKYLHADEEPFFVGGENFPILKVAQHKIGLAICYELSVPQHAEAAYQHEAEIYVASVAKHAKGMAQAGERLSKIAKGYSMPALISNALGPSDNFISSGQSAAWDKQGTCLDQLDSKHDGIILFDMESGLTTTIYA